MDKNIAFALMGPLVSSPPFSYGGASVWPGFTLASSTNSGLPTVRCRLGFLHPPQIPIKPTWGRNIQTYTHTDVHTQARRLIAQLLTLSLFLHTHTHKGPQGQQQAVVGRHPTRPLKLAAIISTCNHKSTERGCKQTAATDASSILQQKTWLQQKTGISEQQ